MENKLNINAYLAEVDGNFSGFDGFGGNSDVNNYGGDINFSGGVEADMPRATSPTPYQVSVVNSTAGTLTMVLFGRNKNSQLTNFGSDVGITVTPSQTNVSYIQLLQQSAEQPFETSLIRVQSTNTAQVTNTLTVTSTDANGQTCSTPVIIQSHFSAYQFQGTIVDVPVRLRVDANTEIASLVFANTTVIYTFFPAEKVNPSRALRAGVGAVKAYGSPQVPIAQPQVNIGRPNSYPSLGNSEY